MAPDNGSVTCQHRKVGILVGKLTSERVCSQIVELQSKAGGGWISTEAFYDGFVKMFVTK